MDSPVKTSLILMGLKHSGKTTLGRLLAEKLDLPFRDLDDLTLKAAGADAGNSGNSDDSEGSNGGSRRDRKAPPEENPLTCRSLYQKSPDLFKVMEARGAQEAAGLMARGSLVLALGGGTVENPAAMEALSSGGVMIYLKNSQETLYGRIAAGGIPPFLDPENPRESFRRLYLRRDRLWGAAANFSLDLEGLDIQGSLEALLEALKSRDLITDGAI